MLEFLQTTTAQAVIMLAVLAIMTVAGYYLVLKFRSYGEEKEKSASDWLTEFRELHQQGELDDSEYKTIKTMLGDRLQREAKEKDRRT